MTHGVTSRFTAFRSASSHASWSAMDPPPYWKISVVIWTKWTRPESKEYHIGLDDPELAALCVYAWNRDNQCVKL